VTDQASPPQASPPQAEDAPEIVVICTGNIARSPFAMALLEHEARQRLGDHAPVTVRSAGVHGLEGEPAVEAMLQEAADRGLDLSRHRGARIGAVDVRAADLLLTATASHRDRLASLAPEASGRIFTLKEFARLVQRAPDVPPELPPRDRVRWYVSHAHEARDRRTRGRNEDVADPYGGPREGYRTIAAEIERIVAQIATALFGHSGVGRG